MGIESYSATAANNSSAPPMGWPEGMAPSAVNDTGRQMMVDIRVWYENAEWIDFGHTHVYVSGTQFTIGGGVDRTSTYHTGRRVRVQGGATGTIYGTISASGFAAPTTTVTVAWDSGSLQNETLTIALHILSGNGTAMPAVLARSGTKLLFPGIATAPAGWSIDTTAAYEQAAIRVRTSASNGTGGSVDFTTAFANGSTGAYALQLADLPAHSHDLGNHTHGMAHTHTYSKSHYNNTGGVSGANINPNSGEADGAAATSGSSAANTGGPSTNSSGSTGSGGAHSHGLNLAVKYVDSCICEKI
jgi:hypothetical protein